jgi:hypothetical protein
LPNSPADSGSPHLPVQNRIEKRPPGTVREHVDQQVLAVLHAGFEPARPVGAILVDRPDEEQRSWRGRRLALQRTET